MVLTAQEHQTWQEDVIAERSATARAMGWKSLWCVALPPAGGSASPTGSGGVAIFAREHLGLMEAER
eukprot:10505574-Lingulodinium_polyedra.AAC.1